MDVFTTNLLYILTPSISLYTRRRYEFMISIGEAKQEDTEQKEGDEGRNENGKGKRKKRERKNN